MSFKIHFIPSPAIPRPSGRGKFIKIEEYVLDREVKTEDGETISEWEVSKGDIKSFLLELRN
jgi:hypothetical protein